MSLPALGACLAPLLLLLPFGMTWAWLKTYPIQVKHSTKSETLLIGVSLLAVTALAVIRVSQGQLSPASGAVGCVQAFWVVTAHPVWFLLGLIGFVHLMVLPAQGKERLKASRILSLAALSVFGVVILWFLIADPNMTAQSFDGFLRFTPLNLSVGAAFALATKFLFDDKIKDRQISILTLLMVALFVGGVGAMVLLER
jgi:hypothetical protein